MSERDVSRKKMEARIEEAEGYLKVLRARVRRAGAEAQGEAEKRIRELESWTRSARQRLERAGEKATGAGKSAWDELEGRWSRLQGAVDGLLSRLDGDDD